ncbi:hypothetical protein NA56DRAFT_697875 [Hyaloscypha hepaticicola]|uniref:Uncharacterized protein n=1 Tax=Hyaloscypha hepaticicola TaxID=2082293 RepID=A0A2J6QK76_9HELO|nr:hypothetical protein NA56DRAFT_697875 [Hyaloscypha hepaticicola]
MTKPGIADESTETWGYNAWMLLADSLDVYITISSLIHRRTLLSKHRAFDGCRASKKVCSKEQEGCSRRRFEEIETIIPSRIIWVVPGNGGASRRKSTRLQKLPVQLFQTVTPFPTLTGPFQ